VAPTAIVGTDQAAIAVTQVPAARRTRRSAANQPLVATLPREVEYAYIRADLRRLIIIAAALLALMFVILFVVER
jgi:hypothetical protein